MRMAAKRRVGFVLFLVALALLGFARSSLPADAPAQDFRQSEAFEANVSEFWKQLPPLQAHDLAEAKSAGRQRREENYRAMLEEKMADRWFAALLSAQEADEFSIQRRFESWRELVEFLMENEALTEVWVYPEADGKARRVPATELGPLKKQKREQPTFVTATFRDRASSGALVTNRIEFGFQAASKVLAADAAYQRHREIQLAAREVLGSRDDKGRLNAMVQWAELFKAAQSRRLPLATMPIQPPDAGDLIVALEYEVDEFNNYTNIARVYRESEIERNVVQDGPRQSVQVLSLKTAGSKESREARGFTMRFPKGALEPAPSPVPSQDFVELRVKRPGEPDPRRWNVLDFGEPRVVQESALAKFSLISAYLEKKRKELALKQSRLDLIAEPIFAGLNIGGGLAAVGFPIGEAARLGYNVTIVPWLIPAVPSVKEMRELFRLITARDKVPDIRVKPTRYLDENDYKRLQEASKNLTDADVVEYLQHISDEDLQAMLRLAKMARIDAKVSNLLNIMAGAGKVSGWTDEAGWQRDVFNSIYFSVTGEVSIKNIIAVLVGGEVATPKSGVSLKDLSQGKGPQEAWLQYLNFTVDIRAVVNTIARLSHRTLAGKELKKPFAYSPRLSDLSAYEIRIFGFPLLMFYKRGLAKEDYASYLNDYAYGMIGATIVEHFPTLEDMEAEIRAGTMVPLGYIRVPDGKGGWKETNLAVFAHRIRNGKRKGKTSVVIYGLKAYAEQSRLIERDYLRFKQMEQALRDGGVIEQLVDAEDRSQLGSQEFEPKIIVGEKAGEDDFGPLLGAMQELHRGWQRKSWGLVADTNETQLLAGISENLKTKGIVPPERDPLVGVDRFSSSFAYRKQVAGKSRVAQMTLVPSQAQIERELAKAREGERIEQLRREAVSERGDGIIFLNSSKQSGAHYEIGPLLQDEKGEVIGAGVRSGAKAMDEVFDKINQLPMAERARLQFNHFAATLLDWDSDGTGKPEKVFLTIEFPVGKKTRRVRTNPLSGERELTEFEQGRLVALSTDNRLVEVDYAKDGQEQASRTYANTGSREAPIKGALLDETRTLETWSRDLSQPGLDPYQPLITKMKVDHVTGAMSRETYGLFPLPVSTADDQFVTSNRFNAFGIFDSTSVFDNGAADADFARPLSRKVLEPIVGRERFRLTTTLPPAELANRRDLRAQGYTLLIDRRDMVKGLSRTITLDNAHFGRKSQETWADQWEGSPAFTTTSSLDYRDDFYFGLIPAKTSIKAGPNGTVLAEVETRNWDPSTRRLTAAETDYTGKTNSKVWDYRWENPVSVESESRLTIQDYNRDQTSVTGTTKAKASGDVLGSFSGQFNGGART